MKGNTPPQYIQRNPKMTSAPWTYDLKCASPDILRAFSLMFHDPTSDELHALLVKSNLTNKKWKSEGNVHSILKYTTGTLKCDEVETRGLLRSVVLDQYGKIMAYSPPKCVTPRPEEFSSRFSDENIIVEEFVEGTMINVFYHKPNGQEEGAGWDLATKSCVGGNIVFHSVATTATLISTTPGSGTGTCGRRWRPPAPRRVTALRWHTTPCAGARCCSAASRPPAMSGPN